MGRALLYLSRASQHGGDISYGVTVNGSLSHPIFVSYCVRSLHVLAPDLLLLRSEQFVDYGKSNGSDLHRFDSIRLNLPAIAVNTLVYVSA